jgi:hypothetical protein
VASAANPDLLKFDINNGDDASALQESGKGLPRFRRVALATSASDEAAAGEEVVVRRKRYVMHKISATPAAPAVYKRAPKLQFRAAPAARAPAPASAHVLAALASSTSSELGAEAAAAGAPVAAASGELQMSLWVLVTAVVVGLALGLVLGYTVYTSWLETKKPKLGFDS